MDWHACVCRRRECPCVVCAEPCNLHGVCQTNNTCACTNGYKTCRPQSGTQTSATAGCETNVYTDNQNCGTCGNVRFPRTPGPCRSLPSSHLLPASAAASACTPIAVLVGPHDMQIIPWVPPGQVCHLGEAWCLDDTGLPFLAVWHTWRYAPAPEDLDVRFA